MKAQQQLSPLNEAVFDKTKKYRYLLTRHLSEQKSVCTFIMLNPSTADATSNDPTVARCIQFSKKWGYGKLNVLNIFAYRSTDPSHLYTLEDPVGPDNNKFIEETVSQSDLVIAAWGVHAALNKRGEEVGGIVSTKRDLHCLSVTKDGYPGHPLYLKKDSLPLLYLKRKVPEE
jgi:hypothetical protein